MSPFPMPVSAAAAPLRGQGTAVVVGDPAFDARRLPWLARLPAAGAEARAIAATLGSASRLLVEGEATPDAVRSAIRQARVLHLAAHALAGESGATAIALAADPAHGASGLVAGEELTSGDVELVVLSACATLEDREADGLFGLAGPFLDRGARAVLGTLWPVEDRAMAGWMADFHRRLAGGEAASMALAAVQREAAASSCCDWAALALIGDVRLPHPDDDGAPTAATTTH